MPSSVSVAATPWAPLEPQAVAELLSGASVRWWLAGGVALDRWLGRSFRERENIDISVIAADLAALVTALPAGYSAWAPSDDDGEMLAFMDAPKDADLQPVLVRD